MATNRNSALLSLLLGSAALVTGIVHLLFVPRHFPDDPLQATPYLLLGWVTFTTTFYAVGRLFSTPASLPSMRAGDVGAALFLVSLLFAGALDSFGFTPAAVIEAYVLPAVGIYVGLALVGWSIGRRTEAINRIAGDG